MKSIYKKPGTRVVPLHPRTMLLIGGSPNPEYVMKQGATNSQAGVREEHQGGWDWDDEWGNEW